MEALFLYGLVILFFVALFLFVMLVLVAHPYREMPQSPVVRASKKASIIAYGIFSLLFIGLFAFTWLSESKHTKGK